MSCPQCRIVLRMQTMRTTQKGGALRLADLDGVYARQTARRAALQRRLERRRSEQASAALAHCTFRPELVVRGYLAAVFESVDTRWIRIDCYVLSMQVSVPVCRSSRSVPHASP